MSLADEFLALPVGLLDDFGSPAVYVVPSATDTDAGVVSESPSRTTVRLFGPLDEETREQQSGANSFFIVPASGFGVTPAIGDRIEQSGRVWIVNAIRRASVGGVTVAWNIGVSEGVASD